MSGVRTELREDGEDLVLTKEIDTSPYEERAYRLRKANGKGFIRGKKGGVVGRRLLSIPCDEWGALLMTRDPDALAFQADINDDKAFMALVRRFPHWVAVEGGGLV